MSWACSIVFHTQIGSVRDTAHDNYSLFSLSSSEGSISVQASSCTESGLLDRSQLLFSYTKLFQHLYHTTTHSQRFWQTSQLTPPLAGLLLNFLFTGNWTGYQIALPIPVISTLLPWQPIVTIFFLITMLSHISEQSQGKKIHLAAPKMCTPCKSNTNSHWIQTRLCTLPVKS